jgi:hypothetical protein
MASFKETNNNNASEDAEKKELSHTMEISKVVHQKAHMWDLALKW